MKSKYSLTAIAVATMAVGASGGALAKKPGNPGPDPAFPTVKDLSCMAACVYPFWDTYYLGEYLGEYEQPGVCNAEAPFFAEASWDDTIGEGEAGGAAQYAGGLGMEFVFEPFCGFGEFDFDGEGKYEDEVLFAARQFEFELSLSAAEVDCDGEYCWAGWSDGSVDFPALYGAYVAAHNQACADEGGESVGEWIGEFFYPDAPMPGYEDFEVSLKHIDPGNDKGRQDHPVVTADCYDFSLLIQ